MGGAEVILECVDNPGTCDPGPGGTETINVSLRQDPAGSAHLLRFAQFDLTDTDPNLLTGKDPAVSLATTHFFPTGELSPSGDMHFWDFNSTPTCTFAAENCGYGHVIDDELPGALPPGANVIHMTYLGDLSNPVAPDLGENGNNQWLLPGSDTKLIGQLTVTCPNPWMGALTLDLLNDDEADVALGARIDFAFEPRVTWRANTGGITGGTITVCGGDVVSDFVSSEPTCDSTLPGSAGNIIDLTFNGPITAPAAGQIVIQRLAAGGGFTGGDLSGSFTYTVRPGNILRIKETGTVFVDKAWYAISNTGGWSGVGLFKVDLEVAIGDANEDGFVLSSDVLLVNGSVGCFSNCDPRLDINGDGFILSSDVLAANARVGNFGTAKPSGHTCNP
jgi:hypothetical protein